MRYIKIPALLVFFLAMGLFAQSALSATYRTQIARVPDTPNGTETVTIWINSDTASGETTCLETKVGTTYKKICGVYDTSYSGANWRVDITDDYPSNTLVEYQLYNLNQSNAEYGHTGFIYSYTPQSDSDNSLINWWCGKTYTGGDTGSGCPALSNVPAWLEGSPNDSYTFHVFYNNYGDTLCMQYSTSGTVNISNTQVTCTLAASEHWTCTAAVGQNLSTSTMSFRFYNDNNNASTGSCNGPASGRQAGSVATFTTGPTAINLAMQKTVQLQPYQIVIGLAGLLSVVSFLISWIMRKRATI
ncbi:MAG TPA: hypothetical protein PK299_02110 [Anaerolineales bacterium]|nr:hypothetical protein [Anaerolineales bacterium]